MDQQLMDHVLEWGRDLTGFGPEHVRQGLRLCRGYLRGTQDDRGLPLMTRHLAFLLWLEDRTRPARPAKEPGVDWEALIEALENCGEPATVEAKLALRLGRLLARQTNDLQGVRLWRHTGLEAFRAMEQLETAGRTRRQLSYAEYLELARSSSTLHHRLATVSVLYHLGMPERLESPAIGRLLRPLALLFRLEQDLREAPERRRQGSTANAVVLLEQFMGERQALSFVESQIGGYRLLVAQALESLGPEDPFGWLVRAVLDTHTQMLDAIPFRRTPPGAPPPPVASL